MAYGTIGISEPHCTNLKEVMRCIADHYNGDDEIVNVHRYAARCIVNDYLEKYPDEKFSQKQGNQITYLGGDSTKSSSVAVDNEETDDPDDDSGDSEKMSFSMSEGPPSSD